MTILSLLPLACGERKEVPPQSLMIFAAASLEPVVRELGGSFEKETGTGVKWNCGASGSLARQVELGAPCDVFLSADPILIEELVRKKCLDEGSSRNLAHNELVVGVGRDFTEEISDVERLKTFDRIAMANPEYAPAGRYARQALERLGLWEVLGKKLVFSDDVAGAVQYLQTGGVDAALVYATDIRSRSQLRIVYTFPRETHDRILYSGAVTAGARDRRRSETFLNFVASERAASVWRAHGFHSPLDGLGN